MSIPAFLLSSCVDRMVSSLGDTCRGECGEDVKRNEATGRWFITMGHCGFNCDANNGRGFASKGQARRVMIQFRDRHPSRRMPVIFCADCGARGEMTGHMTCQFPQDR